MVMGKLFAHATRAPWLAASLIFVLIRSSAAYALSPTQEIKSTVAQVVDIVTDPGLHGKAHQAQQLKLLKATIFSRFDFREMAKSSMGTYWRHLTLGQQNQFVSLFTDLLVKTYTGDVESFNKDKFIYTNERLQGSYAEVDSKVVRANGDEIMLAYQLHLSNNDWKIYDLAVDHVSLVNNYRSQFDDVINRYSYGELLRRLKNKVPANKVVG